MRRYSGFVPAKTRPVALTLKYPTFSDFTPNQLDFYLYWRSTVGTPDFKKASEGYCWLFVCELINSEDRQKSSELLNFLATAENSYGEPVYPELFATALEYSYLNGTPPPQYSHWMDRDKRFHAESRYLAQPVSDLPTWFFDRYAYYCKITYGPDASALLGSITRSYEKALLKNTNKSFRETFCISAQHCFSPYKNHVFLGEQQPLEEIFWLPSNKIRTFFDFVSRVCYGEEVSFSEIEFGKELADIVKNAKTNGDRSPSVGPTEKDNGVSIRRLGTECTELGPSCLCDPFAETAQGPVNLGDILTYRNMLPAREVAYIPSGYEYPAYSDLDSDRLAYYLRWKNEFENGNRLDTDNGYLNLYMTELINTDEGMKTHGLLRNLWKTYDFGDSNNVGRIFGEHAIMNDIPFGNYTLIQDRWILNRWIGMFLEGTNDLPLSEAALECMRFGYSSYCHDEKEIPPFEPFTKSIRRIVKTLSERGGIKSLFELKSNTVRRTLYYGYVYLRGSTEKSAKIFDYVSSKKFNKFVDKVADYVSILCEEPGKKKIFKLDGLDCVAIIRKECVAWNNAQRRLHLPELNLDSENIQRAQSELDQVTEMMKTEEEPSEKEEKTATEKEEKSIETQNGSPWKRFFGMLTEGETEYLRARTENKNTKPILEKLGITANKIEDSINSKSLDAIGDTVIENGVPVEDYLKDIRMEL